MKKRMKPLICVAVCLVIVISSFVAAPVYSKYIIEGVGDLLHSIVSGPKLTVTFKNGDEIVNVITVDYNEVITINHDRPDNITPPEADAEWQGWVNALGVAVPNTVKITKNVVFNAKWNLTDYYVYYLDLDGNIVHEEKINKSNQSVDIDSNDQTKLNGLLTSMESSLNTAEITDYGLKFSLKWKDYSIPNPVANVYVSPDISFGAGENADTSIKITPQVDSNGNIIDANGDGYPDGLIVSGASFSDNNMDISIPNQIAGIPVISIADNAFAGFDNLHVVRIPKSVTVIGADAFSGASLGLFQGGETITIYYEGSKAEWDAITKASGWDDGLSESTNIFFLNGGDKVDSSQGYIKRTTSWLGVPNGWAHDSTLESSFNYDYTAPCNCGIDGCNGNPRPDAKYWPAR
jgi:hypothetical protein